MPHVIVSSLSSEDWSLGESIQGVNFYSVYNTETKKLDLNSDLDSKEIGMFEVVTVKKLGVELSFKETAAVCWQLFLLAE